MTTMITISWPEGTKEGGHADSAETPECSLDIQSQA